MRAISLASLGVFEAGGTRQVARVRLARLGRAAGGCASRCGVRRWLVVPAVNGSSDQPGFD